MPIEPEQTVEVPVWIRRVGQVSWRLLAAAVLVWLLAELAQKLTVIVVPVAVALLLTAVFQPVVARLDRDRLPDWLVPLGVVLVLLALIVGITLAIGVRIAEQLPQLHEDFSQALSDVEERYSVQLPALPGSGSSESSGGQSTSGGDGSGGGGGVSASEATSAVRLGAEILFGLFLTLALAFLFLKDGDEMWQWFVGKLGDGVRGDVDVAGRAAWDTLGTYVRGLTVVALFDAVGIGVGLLVLGVPLVLTLAALQFVASYIPTIGAFVAGGIAALVAFGTGGLATAAFVVVIAVVVQQIGNDVIEPWIMGNTLPISPAVVLIAVSVGAILWGIAGALLLVPLIAAASAAGHELWERRRAWPRVERGGEA